MGGPFVRFVVRFDNLAFSCLTRTPIVHLPVGVFAARDLLPGFALPYFGAVVEPGSDLNFHADDDWSSEYTVRLLGQLPTHGHRAVLAAIACVHANKCPRVVCLNNAQMSVGLLGHDLTPTVTTHGQTRWNNVCVAHYINEPGLGQKINTAFLEDELGTSVQAVVLYKIHKGDELLACYGRHFGAHRSYAVSKDCPCQQPTVLERRYFQRLLLDNMKIFGMEPRSAVTSTEACHFCHRGGATDTSAACGRMVSIKNVFAHESCLLWAPGCSVDPQHPNIIRGATEAIKLAAKGGGHCAKCQQPGATVQCGHTGNTSYPCRRIYQ